MKIAVAIWMGIILASVAVQATPSEADLKKIQQQLAQEQRASEENKQKSDEMRTEIQKVQKQMVTSAKDVTRYEDQLSKLEVQLDDLNNQTKDLEGKLGLRDEQMVKVVTGLQTLALRPKEMLLLSPEKPIDIVRSQSLMYASVPVIGQATQQIKVDLLHLNNLKSQTLKKKAEVQSATERLTDQTEIMDKLIKQKSMLQRQYDAQYDQARTKAKQLAGKASDLKDLLDKLEKEREEQTAERARRSYLASPHIRAEKPAPVLMSSAPSGAFEKSYGSLLYPVRGKIIAGFNTPMTGGVASKGLSIQTRGNAQVIAPFDGTVMFAGPFKGYGQLLILDHNNGYFSLIGGMGEVHVSLGQELLAGEPVGQMRASASPLYVEIRKDGTAIDPKPWFIPVI